jgi:hypothetical protein
VGHSRLKKMMQANCTTSFNVLRFHGAAKASQPSGEYLK